ncbi:hypothetical protein [Roseomonas sp. BN140053]|uniref:hypothetical protein n=1 Tax=Roseomonas sp. BN140053 TaxID=3391898 RepID=UPI0039E8FF00
MPSMTSFRSSLTVAAALFAALGTAGLAQAAETRAPFSFETFDTTSGVASRGVPLGEAPTAQAGRELPALARLWSPADAGARGVLGRNVAQNDAVSVTR